MKNRTFSKEDFEFNSNLSIQLPLEKRISLMAFLYILYIGYKIDRFLRGKSPMSRFNLKKEIHSANIYQ